MRVAFIGTGDAFGTAARAHTCFRLDHDGRTLLVDFGASSILGWRRLGYDLNDIDSIVISHLHGDHFGGLPFLMLESQYVAGRAKPLEIVGPPGLRVRLAMAMEAFFPGSTGSAWRFQWTTRELSPGVDFQTAGFFGRTAQVRHAAGAPSTALRLSAGGKTFAYSGDTSWVEELVAIARDADLFVCECYGAAPGAPGHMDWVTLQSQLPRFAAKKILLTHMSAPALALGDAMRAAGVDQAHDGLVLDL